MSLNWDVSNVKDHKRVTTHPDDVEDFLSGKIKEARWHPATEVIINRSIELGYGDITESNWKDIYTRIFLYERLMGAGYRFNPRGTKGLVDRFITPEDVYNHIGMRINVTALLYSAAEKRIMELGRQEAGYRLSHFAAELKEKEGKS
jgi:hypothetical protein